jgi:hypothetical protein
MSGSAQRISVRLQRATISQATQMDPLWAERGWGPAADSGSHTFPKMRYRPHRKTSKNKGFARWENHDGGSRQGSPAQSVGLDPQQGPGGPRGSRRDAVQNGINTNRGKVRLL